MDEKIAKLKEWIDGSDNIVFSAVRAYRPRAAFRISARWTVYTTSSTSTRRRPFSATRSFLSETEEFYRFYRAKMLALDAKPNAAHLKLAEWEREGQVPCRCNAEHRRSAPEGRLEGSA